MNISGLVNDLVMTWNIVFLSPSYCELLNYCFGGHQNTFIRGENSSENTGATTVFTRAKTGRTKKRKGTSEKRTQADLDGKSK